MKLKKLLQGTTFAAVAAVCMVTGIVTVNAAADTTPGSPDAAGVDVTVSGTSQTMTVISDGQEVLVGTVKIAKKKTGDVATVAAWDVYTQTDKKNGVQIDLSKLSNVKDNYIAVQAETAAVPTIIKIPTTEKKFVAAFDAATATLSVGATKNDLAAVTENYEFRTAYNSWDEIVDSKSGQIDLTKYQQQGATLYVRAKGKDGSLAASETEKVTYKVGTAETEVSVYTGASQLPGKEAKVNIPVLAKGPAIAADYVKGTVNIPKLSEYRVVGSKGISDVTDATKNTTTKVAAVTVENLMALADSKDDTAWVEVRTSAVAADGKKAAKPASKWNRLAIAKQTAVDVTEGKANELPRNPDDGEAYGDAGIKTAALPEGDKATVLEVTYNMDAKKGTPKNVVIKNTGAYDYEIVTVAGSEATVSDIPADAKATKIAKGGKSVTLAIAKVADGDSVFIRKAGDKKTTTWVGLYSKLGVVDYPKTYKAPTEG